MVRNEDIRGRICVDGRIYVRLMDYLFRHESLENINLYDFIQWYEVVKQPTNTKNLVPSIAMRTCPTTPESPRPGSASDGLDDDDIDGKGGEESVSDDSESDATQVPQSDSEPEFDSDTEEDTETKRTRGSVHVLGLPA
jgi:hypothetical protein